MKCRSHRNFLTVTYVLNRSDRVFWFGPTEFGIMCVTVRFCVEAIYTPPPTLHLWREPSEHTYTSNTHFSEREPPTLVLSSRYSIPTIWILISSLPQVAFHSNHLSTKSNPMRESWVLGRLSFEAQEQGVHHQHTIYYLLESGVS